MPLLHCISSFEGTVLFIKNCKIQPPGPDLSFLAVCISFYIIRYHLSQAFIKLQLILSEKIAILSRIFLLTDSPKPPTHLTTKIHYVWQRFFLDAPLLTPLTQMLLFSSTNNWTWWPDTREHSTKSPASITFSLNI